MINRTGSAPGALHDKQLTLGTQAPTPALQPGLERRPLVQCPRQSLEVSTRAALKLAILATRNPSCLAAAPPRPRGPTNEIDSSPCREDVFLVSSSPRCVPQPAGAFDDIARPAPCLLAPFQLFYRDRSRMSLQHARNEPFVQLWSYAPVIDAPARLAGRWPVPRRPIPVPCIPE